MASKYRSSGGVTGVKVGGQSRSPGVGHNAGWREAAAMMGIDWMNWDEIKLAVPPAYTEYIGRQLIAAIGK